MGCDDEKDPEGAAIRVSIHAPAWGATINSVVLKINSTVSIHAPAWGATSLSKTNIPLYPVSIHAPAWGATQLST